jgi:hypothetical protein
MIVPSGPRVRRTHHGVPRVNRPDIAALASALTERPRPAAAARQAAASEARSETPFAAFYPYSQSPVDPQPRAAAAADARQRAGAVGSTAPAQRRQSRRGDA